MPSRHHFFHKNRSQGSLLNNSQDLNGRRSPIDSPLHSPAFSPHSASASPSLNENEEDYHRLARSDSPHDVAQQIHPAANPPTRPQSQIAHASNHAPHSSVNLPSHHSQGGGAGPDENPRSYYLSSPPPPPPNSTELRDDQRKSKRFFGLINPSSTKEPTITNNGGLSAQTQRPPFRHVSVRRKPHNPTEGNSRLPQQRYLTSGVPPPREEEQEGGGAGQNSSHIQPAETAPPIPAKDPQRLPQVSKPQPQQPELVFSGESVPQDVGNPLNRPTLERQISASSSAFGDTVRSQQQPYRSQSELQHQQPQVYLPSPSSATSTSSHPLTSRGAHETLQQHYYKEISRPSSQQSFGPPSPLHQIPRGVNTSTFTQGPASAFPSGPIMPPPPSQQPPQGRSSHDMPQRQPVGISREGSGYQPYSQGGQDSHQGSGAPPQYRGQLDTNPSGGNYRAPPQTSQTNLEQGRNTPPPSRSRDDLAGLDPAQLLTRHDELQEKYRKVKKYYFEKEAQLQQLQNTLAHQRLSQSRTSLDDNEYANRFSRLDGAINNLSFNIRRYWRAVPPWLSPYVNRDAPSSGSREILAVGRACISRWLVDELLDRYFHPCLEPPLSAHLKIIEKNLRRFAAPTPSDEEKEALLARISNWRLATLDGLQEILTSPQANEYRAQLTEELIEKMTANLTTSLKDPPLAELKGSVAMIIELAVGIAVNIPQESRDVFVDYITPGTLVNEVCMKVETGLPALTNPGEAIAEGSAGDKAAEQDSSATEPKVNTPGGEENTVTTSSSNTSGSVTAGGTNSGSSTTKESKKKSMFGGLMGKKGGGAGNPPPSTAHQQQPPQPPQGPREERVRFAAFMAVEVRGRSVLVKAPVYI